VKLNNKRMQEELLKIPNATINHTATHTIITRGTYSVHVSNIRKAKSHRLLWDEKKNYAPLYPAHLVLRYQVSQALGAADE
jgi:hypothetical protein